MGQAARWVGHAKTTYQIYHCAQVGVRITNHVESFKGRAVVWMSLLVMTSYYHHLIEQYHCEYHTKISEGMMLIPADYVVN